MSRQTSTRFSFLLNLASSASLPGGTFSYTWLSDGTKVSARANDGFGVRMYDPFTARWTSVDPMAAKYPGHSPFNYCDGNPLLFYDPVGQTICFFHWVSDENKTIGGSWIDGADEAFIHMARNYPEIINASVLTKAKIKHDNTLKKQ